MTELYGSKSEDTSENYYEYCGVYGDYNKMCAAVDK